MSISNCWIVVFALWAFLLFKGNRQLLLSICRGGYRILFGIARAFPSPAAESRAAPAARKAISAARTIPIMRVARLVLMVIGRSFSAGDDITRGCKSLCDNTRFSSGHSFTACGKSLLFRGSELQLRHKYLSFQWALAPEERFFAFFRNLFSRAVSVANSVRLQPLRD
jgi:hypothetical protein